MGAAMWAWMTLVLGLSDLLLTIGSILIGITTYMLMIFVIKVPEGRQIVGFIRARIQTR